MQNNTLVIVLLTLIIGLGVGYGIGTNHKDGMGKMENRDRHESQHMHDEVVDDERKTDTSMESTMHDMNAALTGKTGDAFDQTFLEEMIVHHQGAVTMAELALTNAAHQEIKDLATAIIAAQNTEIASMQAWQSSWYHSTTTLDMGSMMHE